MIGIIFVECKNGGNREFVFIAGFYLINKFYFIFRKERCVYYMRIVGIEKFIFTEVNGNRLEFK